MNDGYTKCKALATLGKIASLYDPFITNDMHTSQTVEDSRRRVHIIPVDDDDDSIHIIPMSNEILQTSNQPVPNIIETDDENSDNDHPDENETLDE